MKKQVNVLSLFDGMSCGQLALHRAGINVENYCASEIDKYAIKIAQKNFPNTIHIGDVIKLRQMLEIFPETLGKIDILIGGSPCQGFSFSGKQLNFNDSRSKLFFEFVKIKNILKPKWFLLENVMMKKEYQDVISGSLEVKPFMINSALVSAQNRKRLYWCNWRVPQPHDRHIYLKDILEYGVCDRDKSYCLDANYMKGTTLESYFLKKRRQVAFTEKRTEEAKKIRKEYLEKYKKDFSPRREKELILRKDDKMNCLTSVYSLKEHIVLDECYNVRKLTPLECERLQTLPDNYTEGVSNSQRYKMLGNGWTVDVIAHIFKFIITDKQMEI